MTNPKRILYITYDGLTDPLGQSQILPYIFGLAKNGYSFTILSFEKKERLEKEKGLIQDQLQRANINWEYLLFSRKPPMVSKFYDALRMKQRAFSLYKKKRFDLIHCRSYIAADVGLRMKKRFGVKFLFDMRGFWADEKKDGTWNLKNPVFKLIYKYYKAREAKYLQHADHIISLTEAGKDEMMKWPSFNPGVPMQVIPCCSDMNFFSLTDTKQKIKARKEIGIPEDCLVLSYLGSLGTWYMLDEMIVFFKQLKRKYSSAKFLFLTHSNQQMIRNAIKKYMLEESDFFIREATRLQVPVWIKASDLNITFNKPYYSKISSSPVKIGEVLSVGIPIICNSGIGDVERFVNNAGVGYVLRGFSNSEFDKAIEHIPELLKKDPNDIRSKIINIYSLDKCIEKYLACYKSLFET